MKPDHVRKIPPAPTAANLLCQLLRQSGQYLLPITGPLTTENVRMNALAHLPVQQGQLSVYRRGRSSAGRFDQFADMAEQNRVAGQGAGSLMFSQGLT